MGGQQTPVILLFPVRIPQNTEVTGAHMFMPGFLPDFWDPDSGPHTRTQLLLGVMHLQITSPPPFCSVFTFCLYICFAFGFLFVCLLFSPPDWPGTHFLDTADLELTEIRLLLTLEC